MPRKQLSFFEALFSPKITSRQGLAMNSVDLPPEMNNEETKKKWLATFEDWQQKAEAVEISSPKYSDTLIQNLVLGNLLSDKVITPDFVTEFGKLPGSSGIGVSKETIVSNFFSNTMKNDTRLNMSFARSGVATARENVKNMIASDDSKAITDTLKNAIRIYSRQLMTYNSINASTWRETVYRFSELADAIREAGLNEDELGLNQFIKDKLSICKKICDVTDKVEDYEKDLPKDSNAIVDDNLRKNRIYLEAAATLNEKLKNEFIHIREALNIPQEISGDFIAYSEATDAKMLSRETLTETEKYILENGIETLIDDYSEKLENKYRDQPLTRGSERMTSSLNDVTAVHTDIPSLVEGLNDLTQYLDKFKGVRKDLDSAIDSFSQHLKNISSDTENISYEDMSVLIQEATMLRMYGDNWTNTDFSELINDIAHPEDYTQSSKMEWSYKGVPIGQLTALSGAETQLADVFTDALKDVPPQKSFKEFNNEMLQLGSMLEADTSAFSNNSREYSNLCDMLKLYNNSEPGNRKNRIEKVLKTAVEYARHVGDTPKNDRQARRLELCNKIISNCRDMCFSSRYRKAVELDKARENDVFKDGVKESKIKNSVDLLNNLGNVSMTVGGSPEFKTLSDSIKDLVLSEKKMAKDGMDAKLYKEKLEAVSKAAADYAKKKEGEQGKKYMQGGTRDNARYMFAMDVLGYTKAQVGNIPQPKATETTNAAKTVEKTDVREKSVSPVV